MAAQNVVLAVGNDEYMVGRHARQWVDKVCPDEEKDLALETVDGNAAKIDEAIAALSQCIAAFRTVGLFGGKKVVWFQDVNFFSNQVIMKNERVKRSINDLTTDLKQGLSADQFLIISAQSIDKRSAFFKALKEVGEIVQFDIPERDYEARPLAIQRTKDFFKREGYSIDSAALNAFVEKTGFDTRQIINEVEKMVLYKGADRQIGKADVGQITSSSSEAINWDFTDAIADRRLGDAIRLFRQLLFQKENPVGLIIAIENLFHNLLKFREYIDAGWVRMNGNRISWSTSEEIDAYFSEMTDDPRKMHWFRASKMAAQSLKYSAPALAARKKMVIETHEKMVSFGSVPHELLVETLLARLSRPTRRRTR